MRNKNFYYRTHGARPWDPRDFEAWAVKYRGVVITLAALALLLVIGFLLMRPAQAENPKGLKVEGRADIASLRPVRLYDRMVELPYLAYGLDGKIHRRLVALHMEHAAALGLRGACADGIAPALYPYSPSGRVWVDRIFTCRDGSWHLSGFSGYKSDLTALQLAAAERILALTYLEALGK